MQYIPDMHHRRSIRLKNYDYSCAGLYFITICTQNRLCLFGEIRNDEIIFNHAGKMVKKAWDDIPTYYQGFDVHELIVMPNHIHGIIQILSNPDPVGAGPRACPFPHISNTTRQPREEGQPRGVAPTRSLPDIVHRFKTLTTKQYADGVANYGWPRFNKKLWQRNYFEHIIRDERSYFKISDYIVNNPVTWREDKYYEQQSVHS
ncbi:MAG: transposase [Desulfobacterium sp.]|nr:transposase [Desulfobacterium sp.]